MEAGMHFTDDQLFQIFDEPALWFVRGGSAGSLGDASWSLRSATKQAHDFSMKGERPGPLVRMPSDNVVVPTDQIYSLWKKLGWIETD
jgi:hypothetical protein